MYSPKRISPREGGNVVILGAGASFGSSLKTKPPDVKNFILESKKIGIYNKYSFLWQFLDSLGYHEEDLLSGTHDIEKIFSIIDILSTGLWYKNAHQYYEEIGNYLKIIPNHLLRSFIVEVVYKASIDVLNHPCVYHDKVFKQLKKGDTVISLNYDLIAESSLSQLGKWSEFNGYGFYCPETLEKDYYPEMGLNAVLYNIEKYWSNDNYKFEENLSEITLLKPHGSINWLLSSGSRAEEPKAAPDFTLHELLFGLKRIGGTSRIDLITLKSIIKDNKDIRKWLPVKNIDALITPLEEEYKDDPEKYWLHPARIAKVSYRENIFGPYIIAPSFYKFNAPQPYEIIQIWSMLKEALSKARRILCIGYSFRDEDLQFRTIFNLALKINKNLDKKIGIIDLEKNRIEEKLRASLNKISIEIDLIFDKLREVEADCTRIKNFFK